MSEAPADHGPRHDEYIVVGKINGLLGVRGWVKVYSFTQPRENILTYSPWYLVRDEKYEPRTVVDGRNHGNGVVALLDACPDRDAAALLVGAHIAVRREQLPAAAEGEYYWADLVGLRVVTVNGIDLGRISHLFETGANDVIVVRGARERMIPFVREHVVSVDMERRELVVDWDPDF